MCLCAPLCLTCFVGKGFQHIKKWCNTARSYISIFFYCGVLREGKDFSFGSASRKGISGTAVIALAVVMTESQPRLVTASRHQPFYGPACVPYLPLWLLSNILVYMHSDKHTQTHAHYTKFLAEGHQCLWQNKRRKESHLKTVFVSFFCVFWQSSSLTYIPIFWRSFHICISLQDFFVVFLLLRVNKPIIFL